MGRTSAVIAMPSIRMALEKELVSVFPRRKGYGPDGPGGLSNTGPLGQGDLASDALPSAIRPYVRAATFLGQVCASDADRGGGPGAEGWCAQVVHVIKKHLVTAFRPA